MFAKQQPMNFDTNLGTNIGSINQYFFFSGNAPSLQTRLDAIPTPKSIKLTMQASE